MFEFARSRRRSHATVLMVTAIVTFLWWSDQPAALASPSGSHARAHVRILFSMQGKPPYGLQAVSQAFTVPKGATWGFGYAYTCVGKRTAQLPDIFIDLKTRHGFPDESAKTLLNSSAKGGAIRQGHGFVVARGTGTTRYLAVGPDDPCSFSVIVTEGGIHVIPAYPPPPKDSPSLHYTPTSAAWVGLGTATVLGQVKTIFDRAWQHDAASFGPPYCQSTACFYESHGIHVIAALQSGHATSLEIDGQRHSHVNVWAFLTGLVPRGAHKLSCRNVPNSDESGTAQACLFTYKNVQILVSYYPHHAYGGEGGKVQYPIDGYNDIRH